MTDDTGPAGELRYRIPKGGEWIVYEWRWPGFVDRVSDELSRETRGRRTKEGDNQCSSEAETAKLCAPMGYLASGDRNMLSRNTYISWWIVLPGGGTLQSVFFV